MTELDRIDLKILDALQAQGRLSMTELAERVGLSASPCTERVRRLVGPSPQADWTVELFLNDVLMDTVQTGADGGYAFTGVAPGSGYGVRLLDQLVRDRYEA